MNVMRNIKDNIHMGCVLVFIIAAILLALYLGNDIKKKDVKRKETVSDTASINNTAYRTYERIHLQQLMEDPMFLDLYNENEALKQKLDFIRATADDMQEHIDYFENKGFNVSDMQDIIDNIISESEY